MNMIDKTVDEQFLVASEIDKCVKKSKIKIYDITKRLIDIIFGFIGCIILLPLMVLVKIINIINKDKGSLFYIQKRIGKNGKEFKIYKFRTMVKNADRKLRRILKDNESMRKEYEINKKIKNDPRITKAGKMLRKTSLDEFPQFINVLKGDMSLVGTRPPTEAEFEQYNEHYRRRLSMTPGLTGLWQVSGRSDIQDFDEVVRLDLKYIDNWSLTEDFKILLQTVGVVLFGKGAK